MHLLKIFIKNAERSGISADISNFKNVPSNIYCFDRLGKIIDCNDSEAKTYNINNAQDMLGLTVFDITSEDIAACYQFNNEQVLRKRKGKIAVEPVLLPNGSKIDFLSYKVPLRSLSNKIVGVIGLSFSINHEWLSNSINLPVNVMSEKTNILSLGQTNCLYYLVRGMTMKQIAATLNLSPKTVEHYLDTVKLKLNCHSRAELIEKALKITTIKEKLF